MKFITLSAIFPIILFFGCRTANTKSETLATGVEFAAGYSGFLYSDHGKVYGIACKNRDGGFENMTEVQSCDKFYRQDIKSGHSINIESFVKKLPDDMDPELVKMQLADGNVFPDGKGALWDIYQGRSPTKPRIYELAGTVFGKSKDCAPDFVRKRLVTQRSDCGGYGTGVDKSYSIRIGNRCIEMGEDTSIGQACLHLKTLFRTRNVYINDAFYSDSNICAPNKTRILIAINDHPRNKCHGPGSGVNISGSIKIQGQCLPLPEGISESNACERIFASRTKYDTLNNDKECTKSSIASLLHTDFHECAGRYGGGHYKIKSMQIGNQECFNFPRELHITDACHELVRQRELLKRQ